MIDLEHELVEDYRTARGAAPADAEPAGPRARLAPGHERGFMLAGRAVFTVLNTATGNRFTFKITTATPSPRYPVPAWFVGVLTGPNNEGDYRYLGMIRGGQFQATARTAVATGAPSFMAFNWLWRHVDALPASVEIYHEGRCGRCGRALTVPESVVTGLGPVCAGKGV